VNVSHIGDKYKESERERHLLSHLISHRTDNPLGPMGSGSKRTSSKTPAEKNLFFGDFHD